MLPRHFNVTRLCKAQQTNSNLEGLYVDGNGITLGDRDEAGNDFATTVFESLANNKTLKSLYIQDNNFD